VGNYYALANFDKRETLGYGESPETWDIKFGTFANGGPQMRALAYLISNGVSNRHANLPTVCGRWYGDRIGLVGDFSDDSDQLDEFTDITNLVIAEFGETPGGRSLLNLGTEGDSPTPGVFTAEGRR
jgi:hypothetical protein